MKAKEIRALTTDEIRRKLDQAYEELFNLRFQWAQHQLTDHNRITATQRDIARLKTILRERELAVELQQASTAEGEGVA